MMPLDSLPILDLSRFDQSAAERLGFLDLLRRTAHEVGFFYLSGHGIPDRLAAEAMATSSRFFALPEAEKQAIEMVRSPHFRGYNRVGSERTRGRPDWREQIDIGPERQPRPDAERNAPWNRLHGPNQWPASLPELRPILLDWQQRVCDVLVRLLRAFALALGQHEDVFAKISGDEPYQLLKIIRYPGRTGDQDDQGVGAHKDSGLLSAILQDRQSGLQVETADGWITATPLAGTLVVNIGELLELASDGYLRATMHRVVSPPPGSDRISVAFFLGASLDATVPTLTLPPNLAAQARGVERDPTNPLLRDIGLNTLKGRLRSHPDVAQRHYADLLEPAG